MSDNSEDILSRLREIRKSMGLSQKEFGERIGMALTSYASIEQGRNSVNERFRKLISHEYGVNLQYLDTGKGTRFLHDIDPHVTDDPLEISPKSYYPGKPLPDSLFLHQENKRRIGEQINEQLLAIQEPRIKFFPSLKKGDPQLLQNVGEASDTNKVPVEYSNENCIRCIDNEKFIQRLESHIRTLEDVIEQKNRIIDYFLLKDGYKPENSK